MDLKGSNRLAETCKNLLAVVSRQGQQQQQQQQKNVDPQNIKTNQRYANQQRRPLNAEPSPGNCNCCSLPGSHGARPVRFRPKLLTEKLIEDTEGKKKKREQEQEAGSYRPDQKLGMRGKNKEIH